MTDRSPFARELTLFTVFLSGFQSFGQNRGIAPQQKTRMKSCGDPE
jgi:hypothetical protein